MQENCSGYHTLSRRIKQIELRQGQGANLVVARMDLLHVADFSLGAFVQRLGEHAEALPFLVDVHPEPCDIQLVPHIFHEPHNQLNVVDRVLQYKPADVPQDRFGHCLSLGGVEGKEPKEIE